MYIHENEVGKQKNGVQERMGFLYVCSTNNEEFSHDKKAEILLQFNNHMKVVIWRFFSRDLTMSCHRVFSR